MDPDADETGAPVLGGSSGEDGRVHAEVRAVGLTKRFGDETAVSDLSLHIPQGSFYGIVGPNGAGKTTTLSMLTGLLRPDAGTVEVAGVDVWGSSFQAKKLMGVLSDNVLMFNKLTGEQLITYAGLLRGLPSDVTRARVNDLLRVLGLEDAAGKLVQHYSAGMTKKVHLAAALVHAPRILVLDEPFESVDPVSAQTIQRILASYAASGGTVVLSSHVMDLIQRLCSHVAIIADGVVRASGTVEELVGQADLESAFNDLVGLNQAGETLEWLRV